MRMFIFSAESETHVNAINQWLRSKDRDSQPMPEPCETTWCNFCQNWYGHNFHKRRAVWEQRNAERDKPRLAAFRATHPRLFESIRA